METPQEDKDENAIRHYKGTVKQFKDMFDDLAGGEDTNAYGSPVRQGFGVHPTRDKDNKSPHWEDSMKMKRLRMKITYLHSKSLLRFNRFNYIRVSN